MNISLEEFFNNSFVLTLTNTELESFYDNFKKKQLNFKPKPFRGFKLNTKAYHAEYNIPALNNSECTSKIIGLSFSHASIIKMAKALDLPFVVIFESDAIPCNNIIEKLKYYLTDIPNECDILKLGWILKLSNKTEYVKDKYYKAISVGAQAYIVFKKYYDEYQNIFENQCIISDHEVFNSDQNCILIAKENIFSQSLWPTY